MPKNNNDIEVSFEALNVKVFAIKNKIFFPNSESVEIAQKCIDDINTLSEEDQEKVSVLDVGCGTGFIGLAIAKNTGVKNVTFSDINEENMQYISKKNIEPFDKEITSELKISNVLKQMDELMFDYIVANLPNMSEEGYNKMVEEAKVPETFLPKEAFCAGENSNLFLLMLVRDASMHLKDMGYIYFNTSSFNQIETMEKYLADHGFNIVEEFGENNKIIKAQLIKIPNESEEEPKEN